MWNSIQIWTKYDLLDDIQEKLIQNDIDKFIQIKEFSREVDNFSKIHPFNRAPHSTNQERAFWILFRNCIANQMTAYFYQSKHISWIR